MLLYVLLAIPVILMLRRMFRRPSVPPGSAPVVTIRTGKVEGELCYSTKGRVFASFSGIPFAKPPIGKLRFLRPEPADKEWITVDLKLQIDKRFEMIIMHNLVSDSRHDTLTHEPLISGMESKSV